MCRVNKLFFVRLFLSIQLSFLLYFFGDFCTFPLVRVSCKEIPFSVRLFSTFPKYITALFCVTFCNFSLAHYRVTKLFLCALLRIFSPAHIVSLNYPLPPFLPKNTEKLLPCAYYIIVCINSPIFRGNATICNYLPYCPYIWISHYSLCAYTVFTNSPHALTASTFFNNPFSQISGKNRDKFMNNGDKSGKNRYKKLYSPITFQAVQHLHFLACVLIRVTVRVKCLW